ncbi:unnamed protein product [Paramecium sonneborni]|uniref:Transmembrane protein n=1 Tax=Paramecium sonneborni TaxID=65129 RepID=A0A8S1PKW7_9CILI|nr:unnamed protein product [Paramecium sonneborni]
MKKKCKNIWKSKITVEKEFRQLQLVVGKIIGYFIFGECIVILFESIYLAILKFYELLRYLKHFRSTKIEIQGLLIIEQDCTSCKQFIICQFCHHCQTSANHYNVLQMCLDSEQIKLVKRGILLLLLKIISSIIVESYTIQRIEKTMKFYSIYQGIIIAVLFVNSILFLFWIYFGWRVLVEIREKCIVKTSPEELKVMEQFSAIQQLEKSRLNKEQENPKPDQAELEDKGSVNLSINDNISPALLKLKSSLSPSPMKYRSGKILDFLEKKISHAKHSQKELNNGLSRELNRKCNTDQMQQQISLDFGDQEDYFSARNPIDVELKNHNFSKQIKFLS